MYVYVCRVVYVKVLSASSQRIYWNLGGKIRKKPTAESKYEDLFSMHGLQWEQVYLLPRRATLDSKTKVLSEIRKWETTRGTEKMFDLRRNRTQTSSRL